MTTYVMATCITLCVLSIIGVVAGIISDISDDAVSVLSLFCGIIFSASLMIILYNCGVM